MAPLDTVNDSLDWLPSPQGDSPLTGIRVLDFSELLPGPFLTQNLVQLGADVIKLERPPSGDNARALSPGLFNACHRKKRGGLLDLKSENQNKIAHSLARSADVLVESYRPGVMDRLGLPHQTLRKDNPGLVYVSLSGYGANGPWRDLPGHDVNYLAAAGIVSLSGTSQGSEFLSQGVPVADLAAATYALAAINAALLQRVRTGMGQFLDISITDCMVHWMNARRAVFQHNGLTDLQAQRNQVLRRPAYGVFECSDGKRISLAALEQHFWSRLVSALKIDESAALKWKDHRVRIEQADEINSGIAHALKGLTRAEAITRLRDADVPAMEVFEPNEISSIDHFRQRNLFNDDESALATFPIHMTGARPNR